MSIIAPPAFAFKDEDFQLWNTTFLESKLNEQWKFKLEQEFRFGDSATQHYYNHTDGGLTFKVTDGLYFGGNYRQIFEKTTGEWKYENRPHFHATVKFKPYGFEIKNRGRWEYRIREDKDDTGRFRNKVTFTYPIKLEKVKLYPYVADEIFVSLENGRLNRNRAYVGLGAKFLEHFKAEVFYMRQSSEKKRTWTDYNVLGIKAGIVF